MNTKSLALAFLVALLTACGSGGNGEFDINDFEVAPPPQVPSTPTPPPDGGGTPTDPADPGNEPTPPPTGEPETPTDPGDGTPAQLIKLPDVAEFPIPDLATGEVRRFYGALSNGDIVQINPDVGNTGLLIPTGKESPVILTAEPLESSGRLRYCTWVGRECYVYDVATANTEPLLTSFQTAQNGSDAGGASTFGKRYLAIDNRFYVLRGIYRVARTEGDPPSEDYAIGDTRSAISATGRGGIVMTSEDTGFLMITDNFDDTRRVITQIKLRFNARESNTGVTGIMDYQNFWELPKGEEYEGLEVDRVTGEILLFAESGAIYRFLPRTGAFRLAVPAGESGLAGLQDVASLPVMTNNGAGQ